MVLLVYLIKVVSARQIVKHRRVFYSAIPGIRDSVLRILLDNMTLTLRLHPWSLLIEREETGRVSFGAGIRLTLTPITNVVMAADVCNAEGIEAVYRNHDCHRSITLNNAQVRSGPILSSCP